MKLDNNTWKLPEGAKYTLIVPPKPAGFWCIDPKSTYASISFSVYVKPTDKQISNTEEMFGWKWVDNE